jgi:hypothetical protein
MPKDLRTFLAQLNETKATVFYFTDFDKISWFVKHDF